MRAKYKDDHNGMPHALVLEFEHRTRAMIVLGFDQEDESEGEVD
jgi:hypothetical protein